MDVSKRLTNAIEDYFGERYLQYIENGRSHKDALILAKRDLYAISDSVTLARNIHIAMEHRAEEIGAAIYARYNKENQITAKKGEQSKMKAIIYTRGVNAKLQERMCQQYAEENGYTVVETVTTESGMSAYVFNAKVDAVIVMSKDRLSRKLSEYQNAEKLFDKMGVRIVTVK